MPAEWDQCGDCGRPTRAGLVCHACAARRIEEARAKGNVARRIIDGQIVDVVIPGLPGSAPLCPACQAPLDVDGSCERLVCLACGYKGGCE